jgi:hypothetical protein
MRGTTGAITCTCHYSSATQSHNAGTFADLSIPTFGNGQQRDAAQDTYDQLSPIYEPLFLKGEPLYCQEVEK